jgi:hypothetical protein
VGLNGFSQSGASGGEEYQKVTSSQVTILWRVGGATELSSRPERTRISFYAALTNGHGCGFR